jgi:hypothetical protein
MDYTLKKPFIHRVHREKRLAGVNGLILRYHPRLSAIIFIKRCHPKRLHTANLTHELVIVYSQPPVIDGTAHMFSANPAIATNERRTQIKPVKIF